MSVSKHEQLTTNSEHADITIADLPLKADRDLDADQEMLAVFAELPDAGEELAVQQSGPTEFGFFPKLPLELRSKIWRDALPSRYVSLGIPLGKEGRISTIPDVMLANWESYHQCATLYSPKRIHGKEHDCRVCHGRKRQFAFYPSIDRAFISELQDSRGHRAFNAVNKWIRESRGCDWATSLYSGLHTLEVANMMWAESTARWVRNSILRARSPKAKNIHKLTLLKESFRFPNLKKIVFAMKKSRHAMARYTDYGDCLGTPEDEVEEEIEELIGEYLELHKDSWGGIAPTIKVRWP